ncbi:putative bifunctional diguanylate cyclase/phosphodiesterase [Baekduia sp. Peel2402]|uniref:putative bifunctional diguanylate cyclase/phosphodiesterase n=1 Tax=Baekduia sp. Peel2402 TaxID=3458296 RepID=UPI00403ECB87
MSVQTSPRRVVVPTVAALIAAVYLVGRFLPALGHDAHLTWRWWGSTVVYFAAAVIVLIRAWRIERDRTAWAVLGAGMVLYGLGTLTSILSSRPHDDPPAVSFACWIGFYVLLYGALITMLRSRLRPFTLSFCLDGALGGLALAAVCAALVEHDLHGVGTAKAIAGLTLPCAELVLLSILLWASTMTGWRGETWRWLIAAMATMAVAEIVNDVSVARGTYDELEPLSALFPLAQLMIAVAAWRPSPPSRRMRTDARAVLALPAACFVVVLGVLIFGRSDDPITGGLVVAALVVAAARAGLTFREVGRLHEARRFARGFEEATIGMAFVSPTDLTWTRVNQTFADMLGRTPESLVGSFIGEVTHPDDVDNAAPVWETFRQGESVAPYVRRVVTVDGTIVDLEISAALVEDDDGSPLLFSQVKDVTAQRRTARHNLALAELSRVALEEREAEVLVERVTALLREQMPACVVELVDGPVADELRTVAVAIGGEALVARRAEDEPPFAPEHARFMEAAANVLGTALDRARIEDELRTQALEDPLTGLANRSYLAAHVEQAIAATDRGEVGLALLLLDLDRFKNVNDTLGHGAGDELLCSVADRLRAAIRRGDLAARLGGDEFVVVCSGTSAAPHEVAALASRLLESVSAPYVVDGRELHIGASAGLVFADDAGATAESLLRDADVAMYRAKEHGGARYEVFDAGLRAAVVHRLSIESELRHALERDELRLHLQPVVDLHRDELAGFEALVRWEHPQRGLVAPAEFIGVAEETGLIVGIGGWVLAEATRLLSELVEAAARPLRMSVNLSARQLRPALIDEVAAALASSGADARCLTLEVTETLLVDGPGAVEVLGALRALGVSIAIDDFGTGWSSLGALQRYPVDVLKLDRSLVGPAASSGPAAALARAVVEMSQALGLDVVAEGIEDDEQLAAMRALGCPHGQGFVFARPMPPEEALALVRPSGARQGGAGVVA